MLYGPDGLPLAAVPPGPNPLTEERINRDLHALDTLLHIRWIENAYANHDEDRFEGRYALCCHWPQVDGRWEEVRAGGCDPAAAYDWMGWFCEDMTDAASVPQDPESMMSKVYELLSKADNERQPWAVRMASAMEKNAKRRKEILRDAGDLAQRAAEELFGIKSFRKGKKTNDPQRLDYSGLGREVKEELRHTGLLTDEEEEEDE